MLSLPWVGCGSLLRPAGDPVSLYSLLPSTQAASLAAEEGTVRGWQLAVAPPTAAGGLTGNRIAVRPSQQELRFLADVRWTERAPAMLEAAMIEGFETSGKISGVGPLALGFRADYTLASDLRAFELETWPQSAGAEPAADRVRVRLAARLVSQRAQEIVASRTFERVVAAEGDIESIVDAFNEATDRVIGDLVRWALEAVP